MIGKDAREKGPVSLHSVYKILEERRKHKDPTYEQQAALEHAGKFKMSEQQYEKARKKLEALGTLKEETVMKLIDIKPKNEWLLKHVLSHEGRSFTPEELQSVLAAVKEA